MHPQQQPRPQSTGAQKVTAWSAGMIAVVIVGPVLLAILCCAGCFVMGGLSTIFDGGVDATSTP